MSDQGALALSFNFSIFRNLFKSFFSNALFHEIEGPGGVKTKCGACGAKVNAMEFHLCSQMAVRSVEASFAWGSRLSAAQHPLGCACSSCA